MEDLLGATGKGGVEGSGKGVENLEWEINRLIRDEVWSLAQTRDPQTINSTVRCQSSTSRNSACHAVLGRRRPIRRRGEYESEGQRPRDQLGRVAERDPDADDDDDLVMPSIRCSSPNPSPSWWTTSPWGKGILMIQRNGFVFPGMCILPSPPRPRRDMSRPVAGRA